MVAGKLSKQFWDLPVGPIRDFAFRQPPQGYPPDHLAAAGGQQLPRHKINLQMQVGYGQRGGAG